MATVAVNRVADLVNLTDPSALYLQYITHQESFDLYDVFDFVGQITALPRNC